MKNLKSLLFIGALMFTQTSISQVIDNPKPSLKLHIKQDEGTNACAIAYNPTKNLYYTIIAGNSTYPLEVFNATGANVYQTNAGSDMRGIWWNPKTKSLEGNGYGNVGIVSFGMDGNSYPSEGNSVVFEGGEHQPDGQSVGAYNTKKKTIVFYHNGLVISFKRSTGEKVDNLALNLESSSINDNSLIYTGQKKMEYGVLDHENKKVLLYDAKTGQLTKTINLPSDTITHSSFRFGFANNHVFLYDTDERAWTGYKIFK